MKGSIVAGSIGSRLYAATLAEKVRTIASVDWPIKARRPLNSIMDTAKFVSDFGFLMPDLKSSVSLVVRGLTSR